MSKNKRPRQQRSKRARAEEKAMQFLFGVKRHMTSHISGGRGRPRRFKYALDKYNGREI